MGEFRVVGDWKKDLEFSLKIRGHELTIDVPVDSKGSDHGPTPKELALAGVCGCTGMDVASILKTMRQNPKSIKVDTHAVTRKQDPSIFTSIEILYEVEGEVLADKLKKAVELSQTKYCGVSAMFAEVAPITYRMVLNGEEIGKGVAKFD